MRIQYELLKTTSKRTFESCIRNSRQIKNSWKNLSLHFDRIFIKPLLTFHISLKSGRFRVLWHASRHPNNKYHCFSWSCSKFQCLHISHRTVCCCYVMKVGNFQCKFHQFDLTEHFSFMIAPNKKPKQNSSICYHKTTFTAGTRLAFTDEPPSAKRHFLGRVSINLLYSELTCFHTASGMILVEIEHQQLFWQSLS